MFMYFANVILLNRFYKQKIYKCLRSSHICYYGRVRQQLHLYEKMQNSESTVVTMLRKYQCMLRRSDRQTAIVENVLGCGYVNDNFKERSMYTLYLLFLSITGFFSFCTLISTTQTHPHSEPISITERAGL